MAPGPISSTTRLPPWQLAPHWQQASSNRQQQTVAAHSDGGGPAVAAAVPALEAPGPTGTERHQRSQVLGAPGPTGNGGNAAAPTPAEHFAPPRQRRQRSSAGCPGCFFSREGCGGPLLLLPVGPPACVLEVQQRREQRRFVGPVHPRYSRPSRPLKIQGGASDGPARYIRAKPFRRTASAEARWSGSSPS